MSLKDALLEIPELVKTLKEKFNEKVEQNFKDAKLKDGTIISYDGDMPSMGMPLFVLDETGQRLPAPDGEHLLEDGTVLIVNGAIIAEVKQVTPEEPAAVEEMAEPNATPEAQPQAGLGEDAVKRIIESVVKETVFSKEETEAKLKEVSDKFDAMEKENIELKESLNKTSELLKETFAVVEKIASAPSETPKPKKDGFMVVSVDERAKQIEDFRKNYLINK